MLMKEPMHIADSLQRKEQLKTIGELQVSDEMDKLKLSKARLSSRNHTIALISSYNLVMSPDRLCSLSLP